MVLLSRKRRAISSVVTTAILLSAVATIGTALVAWSNTSARTYETNLVSSAVNYTNKINEIIKIENIQFVNTCPLSGFNGLSVTVTNVGTIGLTVTKFFTSDPTQSQTNTISIPLQPQQSSTYCYPYAWQSNVLTTVQATTARGTTATMQVMK